MTAKVVAIGKAAPDSDVIARCRRLLAEAEAGNLRSIMWIGELRDGSRESGWSSCEDMFSLLSELARLMHKINARMDQLAEVSQI